MSGSNGLVLCQLPAGLGLPNSSPFCLKLETWLRFAGIDYTVEPVFNPGKGPKGKLPFVRLDGRRIGDSDLIIDMLAERHPDLPARLRRADPVGHLLSRALEEHLYWAIVYFRWEDDAAFPGIRDAFFQGMPAPMRPAVGALVRRAVRRQLRAQGMGRHAPHEVLARAARDLDAVAETLPATGFLGGEAPGRADASAYAMLASIVDAELDTPLRDAARERPRIADYTARVSAVAFPERTGG